MGDFVEYADGKFGRISVIYPDSRIQLSNTIGVYVSESSSQASGCVWDPSLDHIDSNKLVVQNLAQKGKTKIGDCWTFSENDAGADRGVRFEIEFKVWEFVR